MLQHRFRIDRETERDLLRQRWRARSSNGGGCLEFKIVLDFMTLTLELGDLRCAFELQGTNLSRGLPTDSRDGSSSTNGPFRASPEGTWTALKVFLPDEEEASLDLGLNDRYGQGMLVARPGFDRGTFLTKIFGPPTLTAKRRPEIGLVAQAPNRAPVM